MAWFSTTVQLHRYGNSLSKTGESTCSQSSIDSLVATGSPEFQRGPPFPQTRAVWGHRVAAALGRLSSQLLAACPGHREPYPLSNKHQPSLGSKHMGSKKVNKKGLKKELSTSTANPKGNLFWRVPYIRHIIHTQLI